MVKKPNEDIESNKEPDSKDNTIFKCNEWNRKITTYLIHSTTSFGILFLFVGICAQILYEERFYVFIFGLICLLPIANGVLHYIFWEKQNSTIILIMSLNNLTWIVATIVLMLLYRLLLTNSYFEDDVVFRFSVLFFLLVGLALAVYYYLINQNIVNTKGKTSEGKKESDREEENDSKEKKNKKNKKIRSDSNEDSNDKKHKKGKKK